MHVDLIALARALPPVPGINVGWFHLSGIVVAVIGIEIVVGSVRQHLANERARKYLRNWRIAPANDAGQASGR